MLRKTVPDPYSSDWKCSVAIGWESGTGNRHCLTVHEMKWNADAFETSTLLDNVQRKFKVLTYTRIIRSISVKFTFILTDLYKFVTTQHIKYIIPWFQHPRSVCDFFAIQIWLIDSVCILAFLSAESCCFCFFPGELLPWPSKTDT